MCMGILRTQSSTFQLKLEEKEQILVASVETGNDI